MNILKRIVSYNDDRKITDNGFNKEVFTLNILE